MSEDLSGGLRGIEAFFWLEPFRPNASNVRPSESFPSIVYVSEITLLSLSLIDLQPFQQAKVLWHLPEDVSEISKAFSDIPQYCIPGKFQNCLLSYCSFARDILYGGWYCRYWKDPVGKGRRCEGRIHGVYFEGF